MLSLLRIINPNSSTSPWIYWKDGDCDWLKFVTFQIGNRYFINYWILKGRESVKFSLQKKFGWISANFFQRFMELWMNGNQKYFWNIRMNSSKKNWKLCFYGIFYFLTIENKNYPANYPFFENVICQFFLNFTSPFSHYIYLFLFQIFFPCYRNIF